VDHAPSGHGSTSTACITSSTDETPAQATAKGTSCASQSTFNIIFNNAKDDSKVNHDSHVPQCREG